MKRVTKIWVTIIISVLVFVSAALAFVHKKRSSVLEVGVFAGSNWDVANANSYVIIDKAVKRFEQNHPGVKVHYYSGIRKEDYTEWFSRQLLQGKEPDVFMVIGEDFNKFAEVGIMKDLGPLINRDESFDKEKFYTTTLLSGQYKGRQYALPYETVPTLMFVNKSLINAEGIFVPDNDWTWEDMYEICKKVTKDTDGDGTLDQFGAYNYSWMEAAFSNGASLFDENGTESYFTDEKFVESIRFIKDLNDLNENQRVTRNDFDGGNVAFMPLPFTEYRTYKTYPYRIKKYTKFQWDCITLPAGPDGGNISAVNTLLMGISEKTHNEQLAWEFLKLLTYDEEIQMDIFRYSQGASSLKTVTESEEALNTLQEDMEKNEKVISNNVLGEVIEKGSVNPKFPKYIDAVDLAENEISRIIEEDDNIENSLRILQRQVNTYLKR